MSSSSSRPTRPTSSELIEFKSPERLGYFSCQFDHENESFTYHPDQSTLRYFISPCKGNNEIDLLAGFDGDLKWGRTPPCEMFILRWIVENGYLSTENKIPDFICHSRILTSILADTFTETKNWELVAVKVGNSIVIDEVDTEQRKNALARQSDFKNQSSYSGYKYIMVSTKCQNGSRITIGRGGLTDKFYTVNRSQIGDHSLLYSHGVDCVVNKSQYKKPFGEMKFAKLGTRSFTWNAPHKLQVWHQRSIKWWSDCVVSGIDTIFCGEKKSGKHLFRIEGMNATSLPRNSPWSPHECFQSLNKTLSLIKSTVTEELIPYRFHHEPNGEPSFNRSDESVEDFIPRWFIDGQLPLTS